MSDVTATTQDEALNAESKTLQRAIADMEKRHAEGVTSLREREKKLREATKNLEQTQASYQSLLAAHEELTAGHQSLKTESDALCSQRDEAQAALRSLQNETTDAETKLATLRSLVSEQHEKTQANESRFKALLAQHQEVEQRVSAFAGTEQKLLQLRDELKTAESVKAELGTAIAALTTKKAAHENEASATETRLQKIRDEVRHTETLLVETRKAHDAFQNDAAQEKQRLQDELHSIFESAQAKYAELQQFNAQLQDALEKLGEAHSQMQQTEAMRTSMAAAVSSLTAQHSAFEHASKSLELHINNLRVEETDAKNAHRIESEELESFKKDAASTKQHLREELDGLVNRRAAEESALNEATTQLHHTKTEHEELQRQNRLLQGAEQKHEEVLLLIASTQKKFEEIEAHNALLHHEGDAAQKRLTLLLTDEKAALARAETQRRDEAALKKSLDELRAIIAAEQRRFDQLQKANAETELAAAARIEGLEAKQDRHQREIVQLEARLHVLQTYENDLDKRYSRLAALKEGSSEAQQQWKAIQELKKTIAEDLPDNEIQVRPSSRTQVVPRKK